MNCDDEILKMATANEMFDLWLQNEIISLRESAQTLEQRLREYRQQQKEALA